MIRHFGPVALILVCLTVVGDEKSVESPISPKGDVIRLFNGKDLTGLYSYLKDTKHEDPRHVFSVENGMLRVSGDGLGGLITRQSYRNYHLVCEFKWGERTWHNRTKSTRDSGILVHCNGPDGAYGDTWPESFEAQVIEGGCGDFIVVSAGKPEKSKVPLSLTCEVAKDRDGESVWHAGGERKTFTSGRINWYGRDPDWKDEIGFRGRDDVESPVGQWTRMDVICEAGHITNFVNGVKVNEGFDAKPDSGRILIQTELAEIWVRRWELWPLDKAPKPAAAK